MADKHGEVEIVNAIADMVRPAGQSNAMDEEWSDEEHQ
jgi:hypothetical protein